MPDEKDEVTILSSKLFSVATKKDGVFTEFYGTSMPTTESDDDKWAVKSTVGISLDGFGHLEQVKTDDYGEWDYEYKNYANRGTYIFNFKEGDNNYGRRDKKTIKCTGAVGGMECIEQN